MSIPVIHISAEAMERMNERAKWSGHEWRHTCGLLQSDRGVLTSQASCFAECTLEQFVAGEILLSKGASWRRDPEAQARIKSVNDLPLHIRTLALEREERRAQARAKNQARIEAENARASAFRRLP